MITLEMVLAPPGCSIYGIIAFMKNTFYTSKMNERNPYIAATLAELKQYALSNNEDFKNGFVDGYEESKTFFHADPRLLGSRVVDFERDMQKTVLCFSAFRQPEHQNGRATYQYALGALVVRALDELEPHLAMQLSKDEQAELEDFNVGDLIETLYLGFKVSDLQPNKITSKTSYTVDLYDEPIHQTEESDFKLKHANNFVSIPKPGSKHKTKKIFIPATIEHEQYPLELPRLLNDIAFEAIVGPIQSKKDMQSIPNDDAALRMSKMLAKLRTGRIE